MQDAFSVKCNCILSFAIVGIRISYWWITQKNGLIDTSLFSLNCRPYKMPFNDVISDVVPHDHDLFKVKDSNQYHVGSLNVIILQMGESKP